MAVWERARDWNSAAKVAAGSGASRQYDFSLRYCLREQKGRCYSR